MRLGKTWRALDHGLWIHEDLGSNPSSATVGWFNEGLHFQASLSFISKIGGYIKLWQLGWSWAERGWRIVCAQFVVLTEASRAQPGSVEAGEGPAGKSSRKWTAPHFPVFCEGNTWKRESVFTSVWEILGKTNKWAWVAVFTVVLLRANVLCGFSQWLREGYGRMCVGWGRRGALNIFDHRRW